MIVAIIIGLKLYSVKSMCFFLAFIDRGEKGGACEDGRTGGGSKYQPTLERRNFSVLPQATRRIHCLLSSFRMVGKS